MKRLFSLFLCLLMLAGLCLGVFAEEKHPPRLIDGSNLLTASEQQVLTHQSRDCMASSSSTPSRFCPMP